jgi:hypothetical protein
MRDMPPTNGGIGNIMARQTRMMSLMEANTNAVIGLAVSWIFTFWGLPLFGIHPSPIQATGITACYFCLSVGRTYVLRRGFESAWLKKLRIEYILWQTNKSISKLQKKVSG